MIDPVLVSQQVVGADYVPPGPPVGWLTMVVVAVGAALLGVAVGSLLVRWIRRSR